MRRRKLSVLFLVWCVAAFAGAQPQVPAQQPAPAETTLPLKLPNAADSVKLVATGDTGRGNREQNELAQVMANYQSTFVFDTVLLAGDNLYGSQKPEDYKKKFEDVYRTLLDRDVKFYASLGNHDDPNQRLYKYFNMNGEDYYRFQKGPVSFYALNSNYMDKKQLDWLVAELKADNARWKIAFFHHPPYSSAKRHGSDLKIREVLHPIFIEHSVDVVFTGHDHFYERIKPQDGIDYFVTGAGGKIRRGDIKKDSPLTEKGFDADLSFMLVEIVGDNMYFQVITRTGTTVDSGVIPNRETESAAAQNRGGR